MLSDTERSSNAAVIMDQVVSCLLAYVIPAILAGVSLAVAFAVKKLGLFYTMFHKVEPESENNGGHLIADVLKAHGAKFIFTLCGGHISPILVACDEVGIRVVDTRHEASAVFAADAVSRLSGSLGVVVVTAGPGLTNTITAVKNAQMAESPVLLMGGAAATILKGRGSLQDIDQISIFKPLCKYCASVTHVRDIVPTLREALQVAQSGTPGPVFVEFPIDVLYPYSVIAKEFGGGSGGKGLAQKAVKWYMQNYLTNLFAGAWEPRDIKPLPVQQPMPSPSDVQRCIELVSKAKKPLILIGSQATLPPVDANDLRKAVESMGIPCYLGGMSRGLLGRNSPIHAREKRSEALKEADVVVLAGAVCDFRLGYGRALGRRSKIVTVNRNKEQMEMNAGVFWNPKMSIQADVGSFVVQLSQGLKGYKCDPEWVETLKQRDRVQEAANRKKTEAPTEAHINTMKILHFLEDVISDESVIVADGGDFVGCAAHVLRPRGPLRWLDPGAYGTLGAGGGFALGAKLCRPESDVWIVYGDGSLGYSIAEFDTFTRHNIPVIAVVGNDACWSQVARTQQSRLKSSAIGCNLAYTDYQVVAEGYGGKGYMLDRSNEDKIAEILQEAQQNSRDGKSTLVNCLIGKASFRDGPVSA